MHHYSFIIRPDKDEQSQGESFIAVPFRSNGSLIEIVSVLLMYQKNQQTQEGLQDSPCALQNPEQNYTHLFQF